MPRHEGDPRETQPNSPQAEPPATGHSSEAVSEPGHNSSEGSLLSEIRTVEETLDRVSQFVQQLQQEARRSSEWQAANRQSREVQAQEPMPAAEQLSQDDPKTQEAPAPSTPDIELLNRIHVPGDLLEMFAHVTYQLLPDADKIRFSEDAAETDTANPSPYKILFDRAMAIYEEYKSTYVTASFEERGRLFLSAFVEFRLLLTELQWLHEGRFEYLRLAASNLPLE